jgi:MFS family permease
VSAAEPQFAWRSIILPAFLPTLLFAIGEGALLPIIPMLADDRGTTLAVAGLIAAMLMVGKLVADIPSGWLVARIGERNAMIGGATLAVIGMVVAIASPTPLALGIGVFLLGMSEAVFGLARHAFLTSYVPRAQRARALSTLAGVFRGGWFVGPFVAAGIIELTRSVEPVLWVLVASCLLVVVVLLLLPDPERTFGVAARSRMAYGRLVPAGEAELAAESVGVFRTISRYRGVLLRIGSGTALLSAIRASRTVILPLWAVSIGVAPATASIVIGIAAAADFALFYTSGLIIDRFGRMWGALPGLLGLAAGHFVLAFSHDVPAAFAWFVAVAIFLGVANGVSSGIVMTLGADLAPRGHPAPFLGAFRFIGDTGQAAAPLAISAITSAVSISVAAAAMGALGLAGAAIFARYIPRYLPRRKPPDAP